MLPVLFSLGPVTIYTFGFLLAIGFFLSAFIIWRRLRDLGLEEEKVIDFILLASLGAILFFWLTGLIKKEAVLSLAPWGSLLAVFLILAWFAKKEKWEGWRLADEVVFGLLPLLVLFELGLFFDGRILGRPTSMPWGIYFPGSLVRSQPVSLFSALAFFLIWLFLLKLERLWRLWSWYKSKNNGFISLVFLVLALGANFGVAFWHQSGIYWCGAEVGLSLGGALAGLIVFYFRSGRKLKEEKLFLAFGRINAFGKKTPKEKR